MSSLWEKLRQLDAYPKPLEDFRIKTLGGGTVTLVSSLVIFTLFITELRDYLTPQNTEELFVDTSRGNKLRINLDIVFPNVACSYLTIDAMDSGGESQVGISHSIFKERLDNNGIPISGQNPERTQAFGDSSIGKNPGDDKDKDKEKVTSNDTALVGGCGSCFGAESSIYKCCNTCEEVREAYRLKGWALTEPEKIPQCKGMVEDMKAIFNEGCRMYGYMEVNRCSGSFHIAPGKSFTLNHLHVHDVQPFSSSQFNMTHHVRSLSFGDIVEGKTNPIDGMEGISTQPSTMFQYYLKIVPFTYEKGGDLIFSNQFSTTRHQKVVSASSGESGMPGVFFSYEISPIMIKYSERSKSFGHFATGLCAIVGGVFTVAGLIDKTIYQSAKVLKKLEIGKQG